MFALLNIAWTFLSLLIPAKRLHNSDTVSVHFNHFYCTEICDKLMRDLAMLTYIYYDVDECWLTHSVTQQRFKLHISLNYANIEQNAFYWPDIDGHVNFKMVWMHHPALYLTTYSLWSAMHELSLLLNYQVYKWKGTSLFLQL